MSIIDKVKQHHAELEKRTLAVPEWDTVIYVSPLTLAEKDKIFRLAKNSKSDFAFNAYAIVLKATDENGEKLFNQADATVLQNQADAELVTKIGEFIFDFEPKN